MRTRENFRSELWRRRFVLRDGGLALLLVATVALVATVLTGGGGTSTLVSTATTEPGSALATLPSVVSSPLASPTVTRAEPSSSPVSALPSVSPSVSPVGAPTPVRATPRPVVPPPYPGAGLRLDVTARATGSLSGEVTVRVRDTDGTWNGGYVTYGDGKRQEIGRSSPRCSSTGAPGKAVPSDVTRTFRHAYAGSGDYHVVVHVRTERLCSGAPVEEAGRTVRLRLTGQSASTASPSPRPTEQPSPEPTGPDPSPTDQPSPDPTPEETFGPRPR